MTAAQQVGFEKAKHLCQWLDGTWLEHFVLSKLLDIQENEPFCRIDDCGMSIKPRPEKDPPQFEVDLAAMQGYQLLAISCTTDTDPGMCKLKLFEAFERARNMGGDEAFAGLVCYTQHPENLERQIGRSWDAEGRIRVFGCPHIEEGLQGHLVEWFRKTGR